VRGCVKNVLQHDAVSKMKGGPSEPACRSRLQTAISCWSRKAAGKTASGEGERDECKQTADEAWSAPLSGRSMAVTYLLAMRCPVYKQRDYPLGFDTELENWIGGGKGKGYKR
jgi:hypothetical protein